VLRLVERGRGLLQDGWQAHDLVKLSEACTEAERAVNLARSTEAGQAVRDQAALFQADALVRLERARKNLALREAVLDLSVPQETRHYDGDGSGPMRMLAQKSIDEQYANAFRRWGTDVDGTAEAELVKQFREQPEVVVEDLVAALDSWMLERRRQNRPEAKWRRLVRLAEQLDHDEQRRQLRALLLGDAPPRVQSVAGLVGPGFPWVAVWELARGNRWLPLREVQNEVRPQTPVLTVALLAHACEAVGDWAGAEDLLRQALATRPDEVVLLDALGRLLKQQGPARLGAAIECFRAVRAARPRLGVALGMALCEAGQAREGAAVLRDLVRNQPNNPELLVHLGCAVDQQKKPDEAETVFRKASALQPDSPLHYYNLGIVLNRQKKLDEAAAAFRQAVALQPAYADAYCVLGAILARQQKLGKAEDAFRQALRFRPEDAVAHYSFGVLLAGQKRLREAEAAYRIALRIQPDFPMAVYNLGMLLEVENRPDEAAAAYREAVRLQPAYAEAHNNLGVLLFKQDRPSQAEEAFRAALHHNPDLVVAHINLGNALSRQQKPAEAEEAYRKALRLHPDEVHAFLGLGGVLEDQQKPDEALVAYQEAIRRQRDFAEGHFHLGNLLYRVGKLGEAEGAYRQAIQCDPTDARFRYNLGNLLRDRQKIDEAMMAYRLAIRLQPDYAEAHCNLGWLLRDLGQLTEALDAFQRGHEEGSRKPGWSYPSAQWVRQAERLVELDSKFARFLEGRDKLASAPEQVEFAQMCRLKKHFATAARFCREAFASEPRFAESVPAGFRYQAACCAAQAAGGQGPEAARLEERERGLWRQQALDWLRADLTWWGKRLAETNAQGRATIAQHMQRWLAEDNLAGVRDRAGLATLPEGERKQWQHFWAEVVALRERAAGR
jgi:tetratricopeptide (TPR) repeat protein